MFSYVFCCVLFDIQAHIDSFMHIKQSDNLENDYPSSLHSERWSLEHRPTVGHDHSSLQ